MSVIARKNETVWSKLHGELDIKMLRAGKQRKENLLIWCFGFCIFTCVHVHVLRVLFESERGCEQ